MSYVVAIAIVAALGCAIAWAARRRRKRPGVLSLALFLRSRRAMDEAALRRAVETAWGVRLSNGKDATDFAVGSPPLFMASAHGCVFLINVLDRNYFGQGPAPDADAPPGVPPHVAFMSVDLLRSDRRTDLEVHRMAGRLVETLLGDDCVALFLPPSSRIFELDTPEHVTRVREALRSDDVLASLERLASVPLPRAAGERDG